MSAEPSSSVPPAPPSASAASIASATRRRWLLAGLLGMSSGCAPALPPGPQPGRESESGPDTAPAVEPEPPAADPAGWRIPGEFEAQQAVWLGFDPFLQDISMALVRALLPHVKLRMLVADSAAAEQATAVLQGQGLALPGLRVLTHPLAMFYPRDGAVFATAGPALGVVDFQWDEYGTPAWCRQRHANDARRAAQCATAPDLRRGRFDWAMMRLTGAQRLASSLVTEGGAVESNGQGLMIACEAFVRSRNPGLSRAELDALHRAIPGVRQVIWLPEGLAQDPHLRGTITGPYVAWGTGGHTDEFVRFADARTVLLAWPDDAEANRHPVARLNRLRMQRNAEVLSATRMPDGRPLRVIRLPMPRVIERRVVLSREAERGFSEQWTPDFFPASERRREGDRLIQVATATYLNFIIAPGVVVVPDYQPHGTPAALQRRVQQQLEAAFPGRAIVFIDALALNWLGGGLHCATLHQPAPAG
ncbi:MAG: agmatine/peptidylarginine deiminase [Rubrivivax sp.]